MYKPHLLKNISLTIREEISRLRHHNYFSQSAENYFKQPQADYKQDLYEPMFNEQCPIIPETQEELWPEPAAHKQSSHLNRAFHQPLQEIDNNIPETPETLSPEQEIEMAIDQARMAPDELNSLQEPMDDSNLFSGSGMIETQGLEEIIEDTEPLSAEMLEIENFNWDLLLQFNLFKNMLF